MLRLPMYYEETEVLIVCVFRWSYLGVMGRETLVRHLLGMLVLS